MINLDDILVPFIDQQGADLYLTVGAKPHMRSPSDEMIVLHQHPLTVDEITDLMQQLMPPEALQEFQSTLEYNSSIEYNERARLRINLLKQRGHPAIVIRRICTDIPTIESLGLPDPYQRLALEKRGLILVTGPTGSGKSTSMAAMIGQRNTQGSGHIVTIEDPIEFVHEHQQCILTQRDVGIDTYSYGMALKNVLRQRPDVVVIGEIRDRETMEHALTFAETGHLCIATLHAGNAAQAIERVINFFPEERHRQVLMMLSMNLLGILCQRLIPNIEQTRSLALEVLLCEGLMKKLIHEGRVKEMSELMERSTNQGMISFDQSLLALVEAGKLDEQMALDEADNPANLRLRLTQTEMDGRLKAMPAIKLKRDNEQF